mgnify:CR=1 FL=1
MPQLVLWCCYIVISIVSITIIIITGVVIVTGVVNIVIRIIIVLVIPNSSVLLFFGRNEESKEIKERGLKFVKEKLGNNM